MAIGGIGSNYGINSNYYNYQSSINNLKFQMAMNRYDSTNRVQSVNGIKGFGSSMKDSLNFVKKYDSQMTDLLESANALKNSNNAGVMNKLTVGSSDSAVVSASQNSYRLNREQSFDVNVQQLAAAQQNKSTGVGTRDLASGEMNLTITGADGRTVDFSLGNTKRDGTTMTNEEQLKNMAEKINLHGMGVKASVETKDGVSSLKLTSQKTGAANGFEVSGASASAMGLDTASVQAQDAIYTVSEDGGPAETRTSATNQAELGNGRITATFKKTGSANVRVGVDDGDVIAATQDLVDKYNKVVKTLGSNSDRGSGVINQLSQMMIPPTSERSLNKIGITRNEDGTMNLDKEKLAESLKKDPKLTKDVLGGSSGLAGGAYQDAVAGMNRSSTSLMNYDMEMNQASSMSNPVNFLNMYSKMGSVNLMNLYATGLFFNMSV